MTEIRAVKIIPDKLFVGMWGTSTNDDFGEISFKMFVKLKESLQGFIKEKLKSKTNRIGSPSVLYRSCKLEDNKYTFFCGYEVIEGEKDEITFPEHPNKEILQVRLTGGTFAVSSSIVSTTYSTPSQYIDREDLTYQGRFLIRASKKDSKEFPVFEQTVVNSGVVIFWRLADEEREELEMKKEIMKQKRRIAKEKSKESTGEENEEEEVEQQQRETEEEEEEEKEITQEEEEDEFFEEYEHLLNTDEPRDPIILPKSKQFCEPKKEKKMNPTDFGTGRSPRRTKKKKRRKRLKMDKSTWRKKRKRLPFIDDVEEELPFRRGIDQEELSRGRKRRKIQNVEEKEILEQNMANVTSEEEGVRTVEDLEKVLLDRDTEIMGVLKTLEKERSGYEVLGERKKKKKKKKMGKKKRNRVGEVSMDDKMRIVVLKIDQLDHLIRSERKILKKLKKQLKKLDKYEQERRLESEIKRLKRQLKEKNRKKKRKKR